MVAAGLDEAPPRCALRACECCGSGRCEARDRATAGLMDRHRAVLPIQFARGRFFLALSWDPDAEEFSLLVQAVQLTMPLFPQQEG